MEDTDNKSNQRSEQSNEESIIHNLEKTCATCLKGKTINSVRYLTNSEMHALGWNYKCIIIFLDDGSYLFPSADGEANEAGVLITSVKNFEIIPRIKSSNKHR